MKPKPPPNLLIRSGVPPSRPDHRCPRCGRRSGVEVSMDARVSVRQAVERVMLEAIEEARIDGDAKHADYAMSLLEELRKEIGV